jgi:hypothetical protein
MSLILRPKVTPQPGWLALSDRGILDGSPMSGLMHKGQFVIELAMPLQESVVLLDHQAKDGWPRTFALMFNPAIGFVIAHRQGNRLQRHILRAPLPQGLGHGRLTFAFDAPARVWSLRFEYLSGESPAVITSHGIDPLPLQISDLAALCMAGRPNSPVLWFGASTSGSLPGSLPWIGLRTEVETSLGPVAAGNLRRGDIVMTLDRGPQMLLGAQPLSLPARGSFAPVLLRAPYFGAHQDILVSADQLIAIGGPETEYLFDTESVLMPAAALVDGRTAFSDDRRAVTGSVALDLGGPALIEADGCVLAVGHDAQLDLPLRALKPYEVLTLMSLLGRSPRCAA